MKTLTEIRRILQSQKPYLREKFGVEVIGVYGSYVRNEHHPDSDIDILIELKKPPRISLLGLVELEDYLSDTINFAVVIALEIIGEAAKRIPDTVRLQYSSIPWKSMAGMRDRIIHGYDTVNLQIVWDTVKRDIPRIGPEIQRILIDFEG